MTENHSHPHSHESDLDHLHHHHGTDIALQGELDFSIDQVWQVLTEQTYINQWFPQFYLKERQAGGQIELLDNDGNQIESMMILDFEPNNIFSFNWRSNIVSFELLALDKDKTQLNYNQWVNYIEEDTVDDITKWLIRMQLIAGILNEDRIEDPLKLYDKYYPSVLDLIEKQTQMDFEI